MNSNDRPLIALLAVIAVLFAVLVFTKSFVNVKEAEAWIGFAGNLLGGVIGSALAGGVAILAFRMERANEREREVKANNELRLLLRTEVGTVALQCMMQCNEMLRQLGQNVSFERNFVEAAPPSALSVYPATAGQLARLTMAEGSAVVCFAGQLEDARRKAAAMVLAIDGGATRTRTDDEMLCNIFAGACLHAARFLTASEAGQTTGEVTGGRKMAKSLIAAYKRSLANNRDPLARYYQEDLSEYAQGEPQDAR